MYTMQFTTIEITEAYWLFIYLPFQKQCIFLQDEGIVYEHATIAPSLKYNIMVDMLTLYLVLGVPAVMARADPDLSGETFIW